MFQVGGRNLARDAKRAAGNENAFAPSVSETARILNTRALPEALRAIINRRLSAERK
jgi:hypothetical protein